MQQSNALDGSKSRADVKHHNLSQEINYHKSSSSSDIVIPEDSTQQKYDAIISHGASHDSTNDICTSRTQRPVSHMLHSYTEKIADKSKEAVIPAKRPTVWGRTPVSIYSYLSNALTNQSLILVCFLISRQRKTFPWNQSTHQMKMSMWSIPSYLSSSLINVFFLYLLL